MELELQKRHTDCVYFLASPLTCKKGSDCEYRHNDIARLNPRDCWYWLNGNCLNLTCGFRHAPLEVPPEASVDLVHIPQEAAPINKTNAPCYFYFNGYCKRGENCYFLHGPSNEGLPTRKSSKISSTIPDTNPIDIKITRANDVGAKTVQTPDNILESTRTPKDDECGKNDEVRQSEYELWQVDACNGTECSPHHGSMHNSGEVEAAKVSQSTTSPSGESSPQYSDQSSAERRPMMSDHVDTGDKWESSPGFDVLVDDQSDQLGYEDDAEYLVVSQDNQTGRSIANNLLPYGDEDPVDFDPLDYPTYSGNQYDYPGRDYASYDNPPESEYASGCIRRLPEHSRGRVLEPRSMFHRRKLLPSNKLQYGGLSAAVDIQDKLRKRKRFDDRILSRSSRNHPVCHFNEERRAFHPLRYDVAHRYNQMMAPEMRKNMVGLQHMTLSGLRKFGRFKQSPPKQSFRDRRDHKIRERRAARVPAKTSIAFSETTNQRSARISRDLKSAREYAAFTGPKTLAQIKEEKRRAGADGVGSRVKGVTNGANSIDDFEGPKPLSELLKDRKRSGSACDNSCRCLGKASSHENSEMPSQIRDENLYGENDDSLYDYDDDEYGLEKRIAMVLS